VHLSLLGALLYGTFSFLLSFIDEKIKKSESAQFGYGIILAMASGILALVMYLVWRMRENKTANMLESNIDWRIIALILLCSIMITPMHAMVINQGGSVGQQTMYAVAIIPLIIGSKIIYGEQLSHSQIGGFVFAGIGAYLMSGKSVETKK
jgi:drug/metabolite transporter (DMT)-like permease